MVIQINLRWLAALLLVAALYPAITCQASAQGDTTYQIGDIVEFKRWNGQWWVKGKIVGNRVEDSYVVSEWNEQTKEWRPGSATTGIQDIRHPGAAAQNVLWAETSCCHVTDLDFEHPMLNFLAYRQAFYGQVKIH